MIIALVFSISSLSIGFAAFSVSLNISSNASVSSNSDTFSVKFSTDSASLVETEVMPSSKTSGITASNGIIDNSTNPTITNLSVTFTQPGQYVEYTFYARNEGEYTAYLNNINFLGEKTCEAEEMTSSVQSACSLIEIVVYIDGNEYLDTMPISNNSLDSKSSKQIIVRLEYSSSAIWADAPFKVTFPTIAMVYSTIDDSSIMPTLKKVIKLETGNLNDPGSVVSIGNEQFYVIGQESGNVKLFAMHNLHVGNVVDFDKKNGMSVLPINNPTGLQNINAKAYDWDSLNNKEVYPFIGTIQFSSSSTEYEGSIVEHT